METLTWVFSADSPSSEPRSESRVVQGPVVCLDEPRFQNPQEGYWGTPFLQELFSGLNHERSSPS